MRRLRLAPRFPSTEEIRAYRSRRGSPCPICGQDDHQCFAIPSAERPGRLDAWCIRGGPDGGIHRDLGHRRGDRGIWYYDLDASTYAVRAARVALEQTPRTDPETIDRVLRAVARFFGLTDAHRQQLIARGYNPLDCGPDARHVFATLPADMSETGPRARVVAAILARVDVRRGDADLLGVYGFTRDGRRRDGLIRFLGTVRGAALIEFAQDDQGRLIGFQYAPDEPTRDTKGHPRKRLTPANMPISGAYHVARPLIDADTHLWLTEATHKANLVADAMQARALGVFGAGNKAGLLAGVLALDPRKQRTIVLALDRDQWGKGSETAPARELYAKGYRVQLARWDAEAAKGPDDALAARVALELHDFEDTQPLASCERSIDHAHQWQRDGRTFEQHQETLNAIGDSMHDRVSTFLHDLTGEYTASEAIYRLAAAPGLGKTHQISQIGMRTGTSPRGKLPTAWLTYNHDMYEQIANFRNGGYTHIQPCTDANCPSAALHHLLAEKGYNTAQIHLNHYGYGNQPCAYYRQFEDTGSAFFQTVHAKTPYPRERQAIAIDEFNIPDWMPTYAVSLARLRTTAQQFAVEHPATVLLTALEAVLTDAKQDSNRDLHGLDIFDALDARMGGQLLTVLGQLERDGRATDLRPTTRQIDYKNYEGDDPATIRVAEGLPTIVLPHIWHGLVRERNQYIAAQQARILGEQPQAWNSRLRIGPYAHGTYALHITEVLQFGGKGAMPPTAILDATPPPTDVISAIFGRGAHVLDPDCPDITPPPAMKHIAIRTGARYGKMRLCDEERNARDVRRVIAQCRYVLDQQDPDDSLRAAGRVGLVTYQQIEQEVAEGLGIPYVPAKDDDPEAPHGRTLHFWACRGSNKLEDCEILLVVGTPVLAPEETIRLARAIYADDPVPLDERVQPDERRRFQGYVDSRLQQLSDYFTRAELTQAAHRNRPLRHERRVVITFCQVEEIDYLPATRTITELPQMAGDGSGTRREAGERQRNERLQAVYAAIVECGESVTVRALCEDAKVGHDYATKWLAKRREADVAEAQHIFPVFPELHSNNTLCTFGNTGKIQIGVNGASSSPRRLSFTERVDHLMAQGHSMEVAAIITLRERGNLPENLRM